MAAPQKMVFGPYIRCVHSIASDVFDVHRLPYIDSNASVALSQVQLLLARGQQMDLQRHGCGPQVGISPAAAAAEGRAAAAPVSRHPAGQLR